MTISSEYDLNSDKSAYEMYIVYMTYICTCTSYNMYIVRVYMYCTIKNMNKKDGDGNRPDLNIFNCILEVAVM